MLLRSDFWTAILELMKRAIPLVGPIILRKLSPRTGFPSLEENLSASFSLGEVEIIREVEFPFIL